VATKKRRNQPDSAAQTLEAIESTGDRLVQWISDNPTPILGAAIAILVVAGVVGLTRESFQSGSSESATALARVQGDYQIAMGATPGAIEIPEPANPETARRIRAETIAAYEVVAKDFPGTTAGALALLEAGKLEQDLGNTDAAVQIFERALQAVDPRNTIRALVLSRLASVHELAGHFAEAGAAYEQAGEIDGYPLRFDALADAARTYAQAGYRERALAVYEQIRVEAPDFRIAPYIQARLDELANQSNAQ